MSHVLVVVVICAIIFVLVGLSSSPTHLLGFGLYLWSDDLLASKEQPQHFILPLGSGVVRYFHSKFILTLVVKFSLVSELPVVCVKSSGCRKFWPKLSGLLSVTDI